MLTTSLSAQSKDHSSYGTLMLQVKHQSSNKSWRLMMVQHKVYHLSSNLKIHLTSLRVAKQRKGINSLFQQLVIYQRSWSGNYQKRTAKSNCQFISESRPHLKMELSTSCKHLERSLCALIMKRRSNSMILSTKRLNRKRKNLRSRLKNSQC